MWSKLCTKHYSFVFCFLAHKLNYNEVNTNNNNTTSNYELISMSEEGKREIRNREDRRGR